jgi:hypothetical protein
VVLLIDLGRASAEAQPELDPPQFVDERGQVILSLDRPRPAQRHLPLF